MLRLVIAYALLIAAAEAARAQEPDATAGAPWALTLFGGVGTDGGIEDFPGLDADFNDAYLVGIGLSRELARWREFAALEIEGQAVGHFVKQDHEEFNLLLVGRWREFPWNDVVRTSVAIGEGISYATEIPEIERERSPDKTTHLLNYLMLELEVAPPEEERWSVIARIHHRSGVFGLYDGVSRGSNFVTAGVRLRF